MDKRVVIVIESLVQMAKVFFHICVTVLAVLFVMLGGDTERVMDMGIYKYFYEEEIEPERSELIIDDIEYKVTLEGTRLYNIFHIDPWGSSSYRPQTTKITIECPDKTLYEGEVQKRSFYASDIEEVQRIDDDTIQIYIDKLELLIYLVRK